MAETASNQQTTGPVGQVLLVLAGPVSWTIQFLAIYGLVEIACAVGLLGHQILGVTALTIVIVVVTLVAALVTAYAGLRAYRGWRAMEESDRSGDELEWGRRRFLLFTGALLSALFFALIVLSGIPAFVLRPCV